MIYTGGRQNLDKAKNNKHLHLFHLLSVEGSMFGAQWMSIMYPLLQCTVESLVATTSPQRPVFQNIKSFQVKLLYWESLVS